MMIVTENGWVLYTLLCMRSVRITLENRRLRYFSSVRTNEAVLYTHTLSQGSPKRLIEGWPKPTDPDRTEMHEKLKEKDQFIMGLPENKVN